MFQERVEEPDQIIIKKTEEKIINQYNLNLCRFERGEWNDRIVKADIINQLPKKEKGETINTIQETIRQKIDVALENKIKDNGYGHVIQDLAKINKFSGIITDVEQKLADFIDWERETINKLERLLEERTEIKNIIANYGLWADDAEALLNYSPSRSIFSLTKILRNLKPDVKKPKDDFLEVYEPEKIIDYMEKIKAWGTRLLDILENNKIEEARKFFSGTESAERDEHRNLAKDLYSNNLLNKKTLIHHEETTREIAKHGSVENVEMFLIERQAQIAAKKDLLYELANLQLELQLINQESSKYKTESGRQITGASELEKYINRFNEKKQDAKTALEIISGLIQTDNRVNEPIEYNNGYIEFKNISLALDELHPQIKELEKDIENIRENINIIKKGGYATNLLSRFRKRLKSEYELELEKANMDLNDKKAKFREQKNIQIELEKKLFYDKEEINSALKKTSITDFEQKINAQPTNLKDYLESLLKVLEAEGQNKIPARIVELAQLYKENSHRLAELKRKI